MLLTAVLAYPRHPTSSDRKRMYQRIANIPDLSGDASFSRACSRLLDACPVAPYLDSSDALLVWYAKFKARMCDIYGDSCETTSRVGGGLHAAHEDSASEAQAPEADGVCRSLSSGRGDGRPRDSHPRVET
jgi:hypothetical protein